MTWTEVQPLARTTLVALVLCLAIGIAPSAWADPSEETGPSGGPVDPDYAAGKNAVESKNWQLAIELLSKAALRDANNADVQNLLGFSYRNSGDYQRAFAYYREALRLNPRHRGAHEYIGETYLLVGDLKKAEEHLAELERICLLPCEEYGDLKEKIVEYRTRGRK